MRPGKGPVPATRLMAATGVFIDTNTNTVRRGSPLPFDTGKRIFGFEPAAAWKEKPFQRC